MKLHARRFLLLILLLPSMALAKSTDREAPIHIQADQVEIREHDKISIYKGHVVITKGSIKITGENITIKNREGNLYRIRIIGKPATFFQLNDLEQKISAESRQMDYQAQSGMLELKEEALLIKNQNRFSSDHIIYDAHKDIVKAGHNNIPTPEKTPRVNITIHPEKGSK